MHHFNFITCLNALFVSHLNYVQYNLDRERTSNLPSDDKHGKDEADGVSEKECEGIGELNLKQTILLQNDALNRSYVIACTTSKTYLPTDI